MVLPAHNAISGKFWNYNCVFHNQGYALYVQRHENAFSQKIFYLYIEVYEQFDILVVCKIIDISSSTEYHHCKRSWVPLLLKTHERVESDWEGGGFLRFVRFSTRKKIDRDINRLSIKQDYNVSVLR